MRTSRLLVSSLAALLAVAGPAQAFPDPDRDIEFVESAAWFTPTTTGIGNLDAELGERIGWDDAEPDGQAGRTIATSHGGLLTLFGDDDAYARQSFTSAGTLTGYLDTIALDLYYASPTNNLCGMGLSIDLTIDDVAILDMGGIGNTTDVMAYQVSDDYVLAQVALVDIADSMEDAGILGETDTVHDVEIVAQMYPICQEAIWTYGTAEAPSGLTANLDPAGKTIKRYTQIDVSNPPAPA